MQLNVSNITYTYPGSVEPAVRGVTATFPEGWCGIVGDNGSGKSTLARLCCGLMTPDSGAVGPSLVSAYCEQDATEPPSSLPDFACAYDRLAIRLRDDLGIEDDWAWRYETLSGGQQKRLQVACALWGEPDVLVMDEPTNHLDAPARAAVMRALGEFGGVGLLISHDRELLDELCTQCLFVASGTAAMRRGNYSQASAQVELERDSAAAARTNARRERDRVAREAQRRSQEAARSDSRLSARNVDRHDASTRDKLLKAKVTGKDGIATHQSAQANARLARATATLESTRVEKRYDGDIWIESRPSARKVLLRMEATELAMGESSLTVPDLYVGNTDHIAIVGANGTGKTTLVRELVASLPEDIRHVYVPQEPSPEACAAVLERLSGLSPSDRGSVLSVVAQLNSDPDRILEGGQTSPGEMRKLMLALGTLDDPALIVMDEPTNHLDLHSTEALERMLAAFPGALLLVSHDAALLAATTDICWRIVEGRMGEYPRRRLVTSAAAERSLSGL